MIKVEALDTYNELGLMDQDLKRIPKTGDQWKVSEDRLSTLLGNNNYRKVFVKLVLEDNTTIIEQKVDNIIVETNDTKVVIENKEDKSKKTTAKKATKKVK